MWSTILLGVAVIYILKRWWFPSKFRGDLDRIPGPSGNPWLGLLNPWGDKHAISHLVMSEYAKKYGPIFRVPQLNGDTLVVVSSYELIHKVLVASGKDFGGRSKLFRLDAAFDSTGILQNTEPDGKWKLLRKIAQRHIKQFGDGLSRLEQIITYVAEEMFETFEANENMPFCPNDAITDAAMNSIAFLLSGEQSKAVDPIVQKMRQYNDLALCMIPSMTSLSYQILDAFPWLRYIGVGCWQSIKSLKLIEERVWEDIIHLNDANPDSDSICKVFQEHMSNSEGNEVTFNEARKTSLTMLSAGVVTTSTTYYALVNIIAHHPEVQKKILDEIENAVGEGRAVTLEYRLKMPYCRAVLLEVLRYHSLSSFAAAHRACRDIKLDGYVIPADTRVIVGLYLLHHDEETWGDPHTFRPERYLDEHGEVLLADHPNRKNAMPFGAGPRVCLGESLALARLFLWMTNMIQRYKINPAPGNLKSFSEPVNYKFHGVLTPPYYEVIFTKREQHSP